MKTELDWRAETANRAAFDWIDGLVAAHERGIRDLKLQRERLATVIERPTEDRSERSLPKEIIGWVVNDVQNVQRNLRLDLASSVAAELAIVEVLRAAETK